MEDEPCEAADLAEQEAVDLAEDQAVDLAEEAKQLILDDRYQEALELIDSAVPPLTFTAEDQWLISMARARHKEANDICQTIMNASEGDDGWQIHYNEGGAFPTIID